MTLPDDKIGDKGQRYEIRYRENHTLPYKVLGWAGSDEGARKMVKTWKQRPGVTHCWVFDRLPHHRQER